MPPAVQAPSAGETIKLKQQHNKKREGSSRASQPSACGSMQQQHAEKKDTLF